MAEPLLIRNVLPLQNGVFSRQSTLGPIQQQAGHDVR